MGRFRGCSGDDPAVLGRELGVAHLVTGTVRRAGGRLRVTVELVRSSRSLTVWADQFDGTNADRLVLEENIAGAVAGAIAGRLLPGERATLASRPTRNPEAYDHFLRGNYYLAQRTTRGTARAIEAYEAGVPPETLVARGAAAEWQRALGLESDRPITLYYLATAAYGAGRFEEATRLADSALAVDPRFHVALAVRAQARAWLGNLAGAWRDAEEAIALADPGFRELLDRIRPRER